MTTAQESSLISVEGNLSDTIINVEGNLAGLIINAEGNVLSKINDLEQSIVNASKDTLKDMLKSEDNVIYDVNYGLQKNNPANKIYFNNSWSGLINSSAIEMNFKLNINANKNRILQNYGIGTNDKNEVIYCPGISSYPAYSNFDSQLENVDNMGIYGSYIYRRYIAQSVKAFDGDIISTSATMRGLYLILDALPWKNNDVFVSFDWHYLVDYGSFNDFIAKYKALGITIHNVNITCKNPVNLTYEEALEYYKNELDKVIEEETLKGNNVKIVQWDDASWQGMTMPSSGMCDYLTSKNILSMVDGAHVYGILDLDLSDTGPYKNCDFYVGNTHKYLNGLQGCGWIRYKGGSNNRLGLKHCGPYYRSGAVNMPWCAWASIQNTVDGAKLAANSYLIKEYMKYGFKNIENNMRTIQYWLAEQLVKKFGQESFACSIIFNEDNTVNKEKTNKIGGPFLFIVPGAKDYPEIFADYSAKDSRGRYSYKSNLPNKNKQILDATSEDVRSSFIGKLWTAIALRGIITRNVNALILDENGDKLKISAIRISLGMQITMNDAVELNNIINDEYDKLIAGYVKCKDNIDEWLTNDKYLTDESVKYLFEMNGNVNRDQPAVFGKDHLGYAKNSRNGNSVASIQMYDSYQYSAKDGLVYDDDGKLVPGEVVPVENSNNEFILEWQKK
jgi:uncharacterized protein YbcI